MRLKLLLVDDHPIVRQGLKAILRTEVDFEVVGEAADGIEAVRLAEKLEPDVVILDLMLPGLNGLEAARQVAGRSPRTRIVFLSMHAEAAYVLEALRAGAAAYVLKEAGADQLVKAVREAAAGRRYLSPPLTDQALKDFAKGVEGSGLDPFHTLTLREREVLQLTAEGLSGNEIAGKLFVSPRTVESHRANLMRKLGVRNQKEMVRYALQRGGIPAKS